MYRRPSVKSEHLKLVEISLVGIRDALALHSLLAEKLSFPIYYGKNWDAFRDVIAESIPQRLTFTDWSEFASLLPQEADQLTRCLAELAQASPELCGVIEFR